MLYTGTHASIRNLCHCEDYSMRNEKVEKGDVDSCRSEIFVSVKS